MSHWLYLKSFKSMYRTNLFSFQISLRLTSFGWDNITLNSWVTGGVFLHINSSSSGGKSSRLHVDRASAPVIHLWREPAAPGRHEALQHLSRLVTMTLHSPVTPTMLLIKRPEISWHRRYVPPDTTQGNKLSTVIYTFSSSWFRNVLRPGIFDLGSRDKTTIHVPLNICWA